MNKLGDDVSYLFIVGQIVFFGLLIAFVVFIAISDRRANKRLEQEEQDIEQEKPKQERGRENGAS